MTMLSFKFAVVILVATVELTQAMRCFTCSYTNRLGSTDTNCRVNPTLEPLYEADESQAETKAYCLTEMKTDNGTISVKRSVYYSERRDLDGKCDEGPMPGRDPEAYYVKTCYCASDSCNRMPYEPPPKIDSVIKCYVCGTDDPGCRSTVVDKYLVDIPGVPYYVKSRAVSSTIFPGFNLMGVREAKASYVDDQTWEGHIEWSTYCVTTITKVDGAVQVNRNATWSKDKTLHGTCEKSEFSQDIDHCYCNDNHGCNNKNGESIITFSSSVCLLFGLLAHALSSFVLVK